MTVSRGLAVGRIGKNKKRGRCGDWVKLLGRSLGVSVLIGSVLDNLENWDSHFDQTGSGFPSGRFGELPLPVYVSQASNSLASVRNASFSN